jgi:hypothetical protein
MLIYIYTYASKNAGALLTLWLVRSERTKKSFFKKNQYFFSKKITGALLTLWLGVTATNLDNFWLLVLICNLSTLLPLVLISWIPAGDPGAEFACFTALLYCTSLLHCFTALLYCAALLHCFTALLYYTALLHTALLYYWLLVLICNPHCFTTLMYYTSLLHRFTTLLYYWLLVLICNPLDPPAASGRVH